MSAALTAKQRELLDYLRVYQGDKGRTPSFDEMREALGLKSKSGVHRLVIALEDRGYIRRLKNHARAIEIVADPHLPDKLSQVSDLRLAQEAKRRGLALCHVFEGREYMELRA